MTMSLTFRKSLQQNRVLHFNLGRNFWKKSLNFSFWRLKKLTRIVWSLLYFARDHMSRSKCSPVRYFSSGRKIRSYRWSKFPCNFRHFAINVPLFLSQVISFEIEVWIQLLRYLHKLRREKRYCNFSSLPLSKKS